MIAVVLGWVGQGGRQERRKGWRSCVGVPHGSVAGDLVDAARAVGGSSVWIRIRGRGRDLVVGGHAVGWLRIRKRVLRGHPHSLESVRF